MVGTIHSFIGLLLGSANSSIGNAVLTLCKARNQGWQELSKDFHNRVSKLVFQEFRVSKIPY